MKPYLEGSTTALEPAATIPNTEAYRQLIAAASRAPSGDNRQPWSFEVDAAGSAISIFLEPRQDLSPMNAGQHMSLIACGAAIENLLRLAGAQGWRTRLELAEVSNRAQRSHIARILLFDRGTASDSAHHEFVISERTCNRRMYDARPLSEIVLAELSRVPSSDERVSLNWITDRRYLATLARLIARGDALMFGNAAMRQAFLKNVRFDLPVNARAEEGLPLGCLELSALDRVALKLMPHMPAWLFSSLRCAPMLAKHSRRLVLSASGLCLVTSLGAHPHGELQVGQSTQRAWLALTELGLAAQPMLSLLVIGNALRHGPPALIEALARRGARELLQEFRDCISSLGIQGCAGFILRFGYAPAPSARTGRRGERA